MKKLVLYYSLTGKTELIAKTIADAANADLKRVEEVEKRKKPFVFISGGSEAIKGVTSKIKNININKNYELIFLGTPIWAGNPTSAINAFISKTDFKNKKVVVFVTMGVAGGKRAVKIIASAIDKRGGKIIGSFVIKTGGIKDKEMIKKGKEIGAQYNY